LNSGTHQIANGRFILALRSRDGYLDGFAERCGSCPHQSFAKGLSMNRTYAGNFFFAIGLIVVVGSTAPAVAVDWLPQSSGLWDSGPSWTGMVVPGPADDVTIDPTVAVTVTGSAFNRSINNLVIGGTGVGRVTLRLAGAATGDLNVANYAELYPNGELTLADGRIFSTGILFYNSGVIRGTGTVDANLVNYSGGEVRVAVGESLVVSGGGHTNNGKLEAIGGELEFIGAVTNSASTGLTTGRNATLRFQGGLTNDGSLSLTAGVNDVTGDIGNTATGTIVVSGGAAATFYDDVVQNGVLRVSKVGSTTSVAVFLGDFTGSGGSTGGGDIFFEGDLRPGNSPATVTFANNVALGAGADLQIELGGVMPSTQYDQVHVTGQLSLDGALTVSRANGFNPTLGQSFDILDFNVNTLSGTFSSITLPPLDDGLAWNTTQLYTLGVISIAGIPAHPGDFDSDGDVDGDDFATWQSNFPKSSDATLAMGDADGDGDVDGADFVVWQTNFPHLPASNASPVPEPPAWLLGMLAIGGFLVRRRL
jgi:MYXO-CTERM domain-containing protein